MATPPTRVLYSTPTVGYQSNASPKTTPAFDVQAGDLLTVVGSTADAWVVLNTPTSTGNVTWTLRQSLVIADYCGMYVWTGVVNSTQSGVTVSIVRSEQNFEWSFGVTVWRDHGGVGASGAANAPSGAPSLAVTCAANSALVVGSDDWTASSGASRVWRNVNGSPIIESLYSTNVGVTYTIYSGYVPDVGPAGSKTVGLTAPTGQKYSIAAVEVLGSASTGTAYTATPTDTATASDTLTAALTAGGADYPKSLSDPAGTGDTATVSLTRSRTAAADPAGASDVLGALLAKVLQGGQDDPVPAADTVAVSLVRFRTVTDSATVTDTDPTVTAAYAADLTDVAPLADEASRAVTAPREAVPDAAAASDTLTATLTVGAVSYSNTPGDSAAALDVLTVQVTSAGAASLGDAAQASDTATVTVARPRTSSDAAAGADTLTVYMSRDVALGDSAGAVDVAASVVVSAGAATLSDAAGASETVTVELVRSQSGYVGDQLSVADVLTVTITGLHPDAARIAAATITGPRVHATITGPRVHGRIT